MIKTYAVIGDPIEHSMSPNIHNAAFRSLQMESTYIAYKIPKDQLEEGIESLKKIQISGFNVTIPHKISIMKYIDKTDENCSIIGAANTISNKDGILKGYNTDMDGFLEPIKQRNLKIKDQSVLLLGAGGAARAIAAGFAKEKAKHITIANRTLHKAKELARFTTKLNLDSQATTIDEIPDLTNYKFIINATSVGLKKEADNNTTSLTTTPLKTQQLDTDSVVYDIVYMPINTDLIKKAKEKKSTVIYGYEMLLGQACIAFEIWHDKKAPYTVMKKALIGS